MELKDLLLEYGRRYGFGNLKLDSNGICRLKINQEYIVFLELAVDGKGFYLYGRVGKAPLESFVLKAMLETNLYRLNPANAIFSIDPQTENVILFRPFDPLSTDFLIFDKALDAFVKMMQKWTNILKNPAMLTEQPKKGGENFDAQPWTKI